MTKVFLMQYLSLSIYTIFMGFCFCDGFKLNIIRKLIWYSAFLAMSIYVFRVTRYFALEFILPMPILLAFVLCIFQLKESKKSPAK